MTHFGRTTMFISLFAIVVLSLTGCGGGGMESPSGDLQIGAMFYDGTQNRPAAPRLGTPDFSGPVGTWSFEIESDGMATQGGTAPLGTVTVTDANDVIVPMTKKAWEITNPGRYHVIGEKNGRTLAEAWVTVSPAWYDIKGGFYVSNNSGMNAEVDQDGTIHGCIGEWSLMITAVGGGGLPGPVGHIEVRDEGGTEIIRNADYRWPLEGHFHIYILDDEGMVIGYRYLWADPNYGRG